MNSYELFQIRQIMNNLATEINDPKLSYKRNKAKIFIYTPRPGLLIGLKGERINRYKAMLKEKGISKVEIVEVSIAMLPNYTLADYEEYEEI